MTDGGQTSTTIKNAEQERGPVTILVNNAGSVETRSFTRSDPALFRKMWNVHLMGAVHASQAVLPGMIDHGFGRVINIASTCQTNGNSWLNDGPLEPPTTMPLSLIALAQLFWRPFSWPSLVSWPFQGREMRKSRDGSGSSRTSRQRLPSCSSRRRRCPAEEPEDPRAH